MQRCAVPACGNSLKLAQLAVVSECDKNSFASRVINILNILLDNIVTSCSVSSFKLNLAQSVLSIHLLFRMISSTAVIIFYSFARRSVSALVILSLIIYACFNIDM